jgi:SAM-dependent methyltransferase
MTTAPARKPDRYRILHVGCGGDALPSWLAGEETRLDIDPATEPDIVASMTDMGRIGEYDVVYCSHALEHLFLHEIRPALREFRRVLKPGGRAVVIVPDAQGVSPTEEVLFVSPAGPVTGLDLLYGMRSRIAACPYMAHRYGFVSMTLEAEMAHAGFAHAVVKRVPDFNLLAVATK